MTLEPLDPKQYRDIVRRALAEDIGSGDVTTELTVAPDQQAHGMIVAKSECVLAGLDVAAEAFRQRDPGIGMVFHRRDGDLCDAGTEVVELTGSARALLTAERVGLNFLQRLSGIATLTRRFVTAAGGRLTVLDTRKTTPTLRPLEKYAVRAGGGTNHRHSLDSAILIKDNHIRLAGGVFEALKRARASGRDRELPLEVEAQSLAEVDEALQAGAAMILVDNMALADIAEAVRRCRGRALVEISGGVTLDRIEALAGTGADYVSVGALTHSVAASDLSLELRPLA